MADLDAELLDGGCRHTPDFNGLTVFGRDVRIGAIKPCFRDAYKRNQRCIIPADAIYEPDWRSGRAVATRIEGADGEPLGIAGLWSSWKAPNGDWVMSYTMLTVNADQPQTPWMNGR